MAVPENREITRLPLADNQFAMSRAVIMEADSCDWLFASGIVASDLAPDSERQLCSILDETQQLLDESGFHRTDIVRVRFYLVELDAAILGGIHKIRRSWFGGVYPASTLVQVAGLAVASALIEMDLDAVRKR